MLLILLTVVVLRSVLVTRAVRIHNDERHYALDGFWVKSGLSYPTIWKVMLHGHMHPHPLFNPLTGIIRPHGEFTEGFRDRKDDLATFPRAGHPPLYMIILGGVFLVFSKAWLLQGDNFVLVARMVNTLLDCLTWLMMYQILRSLFGKRFSLWVIVPVALFAFSVFVLALLRQWRALSLPLVITLITIAIPVGSCVRRLYMLLPFVVLTIALAVFELVRRRGGAGTGTASG